MRSRILAFFFIAACGAASHTTDAAPTAPTPLASASASPTPSTCAATYAQAKAHPLSCNASTPTCTYAEGTCACTAACMGGAQPPPGYVPPSSWECTPRACSGNITQGAACSPEGTHCGRCWGQMWDCKNGKWVGTQVAPPP